MYCTLVPSIGGAKVEPNIEGTTTDGLIYLIIARKTKGLGND